jgi:hypothetical protein
MQGLQGTLLKIDWKLWNIQGTTNFLYIELYSGNGTLLDTVGAIITGAHTATVASEREYSVTAGNYFLRMKISSGHPGTDWYEVTV